MENKPQHLAIILDGNRRWAKAKGMPGTYGHKEGAKVLTEISKYANEIGIKHMTVYAFSTENWKRSEDEVNMLMALFQEYLNNYTEMAVKENIRVKIIGTREGLNEQLIKSIDNCERLTEHCTGLTFNVAINYGSRNELVHAMKEIAIRVKEGKITIDDITEETVNNNLYTAHSPDPDLVIRTSGELRLSNFLLWQLAYAEFLFLDKNWPEFTKQDLDMAIEEFARRNRKFGGK